MGKKKLMTIIDFLREKFEENDIPVDKIIIFGSQAKRTATRDSDIDVVVVSRKFRRKDFWKRIEMMRAPVCATIKEHVVPLDVIAFTPEDLLRHGSPIASYARSGVVVYQAA